MKNIVKLLCIDCKYFKEIPHVIDIFPYDKGYHPKLLYFIKLPSWQDIVKNYVVIKANIFQVNLLNVLAT